MRLDALERYVLLDDARGAEAAPARLYRNPVEELPVESSADVPTLFERLREARARGLHAAGWLAYEAGHALEPRLAQYAPADRRLGWFGLFERYDEIAPGDVPALLPDPHGAAMGALVPDLSESEHTACIARLLDWIAAGDIYQANFTFHASASYAGHPAALYAKIRDRARAGYGGIVHDGRQHLLSFSPELFFALKRGAIAARPMKGTAARASGSADAEAAALLRSDPKQRAENLMIVDLLRNDLSRICEAGSVSVPELFKLESYPTVHQLVSTVTGRLAEGEDAASALAALFPCGSITGAPKIRAMEIIDVLEQSPRDAYCGAIGRIDADGDAAFNVAIRTLALDEATKRLCLGLGSGIVADSDAASEWAECLAKGEFARMDDRPVDLIETMRFEPANGILRLEAHLERMKASAAALGHEFDRHAARNNLNAACFHADTASKIRFLSSARGSQSIEIAPLDDSPPEMLTVEIVPMPVAPHDYRLAHKTSDRAFHDEARAASAADEVVFADADGFLTEGSFTNLFVERDGMLLTPPLARGLLPGVLRGELIADGKAIEADLRADDLADGFLLGNSLRGLMRARLA